MCLGKGKDCQAMEKPGHSAFNPFPEGAGNHWARESLGDLTLDPESRANPGD